MSDRVNGLDELVRREPSWTVRQEDLLRYAAVALDFNTIHFDQAAARAAGFDRAIAHGMWNLGLVMARVADAVGVEHIRSAQTRFSAPAYVGAELRLAFVSQASGSVAATVTDDAGSIVLTTQIDIGDPPTRDIAEAPPEGELVADRHFVVEQGPATRFAATLGARSPVFHRRDAAEALGYRSIPTLPTYGFVLPGWGFFPELPGNEQATAPDPVRDCQDWARTPAAPVHAGQAFTFSRPLFVGERVRSRTYIEGRAVKRSQGRVLDFTDVRSLLTDAGGDLVLTSAMTVVVVRDPGPNGPIELGANTGGTPMADEADKTSTRNPGEPVLIAQHDQVAVLTINRPETRNALSTEVLNTLVAALDWAEAEPSVRAVVITGGPKLFASGADVRELRATTPTGYLQSERQKAWPRLAAFKKPLVAAVAGYVLGGGCEVAMSCDFIVAADSAVLGQPEIKLGIIPGAGGTQRWARVAGRFQAAELVLAGRNVTAWTAHRMGLVNRVVPAECVVEAGIELAREVAQFSPVALRLGKTALRSSEEVGVTAGLDFERSQLAVLLSTEDHYEGIDAFLEKRRPEFTGR